MKIQDARNLPGLKMELNLVLLQESIHINALHRLATVNRINPLVVGDALWWESLRGAWRVSRCIQNLLGDIRRMIALVNELNNLGAPKGSDETNRLYSVTEDLRATLDWWYDSIDPQKTREVANRLRIVRNLARRSWKLRLLLVPWFMSIELRQFIRLYDEKVVARVQIADLMSRMDPAPASYSSVRDMMRVVRTTHAH